MGRPTTIHIGETFGRLEVADRGSTDAFGNLRWLCLCQCGEEREYYAWQLTSADVVSCGCYKAEHLRERNIATRPRPAQCGPNKGGNHETHIT